MSRTIRAVLFDKDGTLFDFDATWSAVVRRVIVRLAPDPGTASALAAAGGLDLESGRFRPGSPIVAGAVLETATLWAPFLPGLSAAHIARRIDDLSAEMTGPDTLVPAVADLPGLLDALRGTGLRLGVATHDSEAAARAHLAAVDALDAFDFVAGYDSGFGLKPGTGMIDAFAAAVDLPAGEIMVAGDSVHDLQMARAAGAMAVGVLTGPSSSADLAADADRVVPSIGALPALLGSI
ncbi:MAG: HAD family hydrolase [Paracoccaceae bacterium]